MPNARSTDEVVSMLAAQFAAGPPSEATVRTQGFHFYPRHWTKRWPDRSAVALPPVLQDEKPRGYVDRAALLASASEVTTATDAVDFYVRVCAWGTGTKARMVARRTDALGQPGLAKALLASHETVRSGKARAAYAQLGLSGEHRVKHLGPAFFTKWLYFAAYDDWTDQDGPRPLILDARVAQALGCGAPAGLPMTTLATSTAPSRSVRPGVLRLPPTWRSTRSFNWEAALLGLDTVESGAQHETALCHSV